MFDAEFNGAANAAANGLDTAPVSLRARQAAFRGPPAIAVHDDCDMARSLLGDVQQRFIV
jgi:hypothetical protein